MNLKILFLENLELKTKIESLEKEKKEIIEFLLSLVMNKDHIVNKIDILESLVNDFHYQISKEEALKIQTEFLNKEEQNDFTFFIKRNFSEDFFNFFYEGWIRLSKEIEDKLKKENLK